MGGIFKSIGGLFSGKTKTRVVTPKVEQTRRRPVQTDNSKEAAKKRQRVAFRKRQGRESTILSDELRELTGSSGRSLGG